MFIPAIGIDDLIIPNLELRAAILSTLEAASVLELLLRAEALTAAASVASWLFPILITTASRQKPAEETAEDIVGDVLDEERQPSQDGSTQLRLVNQSGSLVDKGSGTVVATLARSKIDVAPRSRVSENCAGCCAHLLL